MKKIISCLLLLAISLTLFACQKKDPADAGTDYAERYLFTDIGGVLSRINVESGVITPLCPDPLCTHSDESCGFYLAYNHSLQIISSCIYFLKSDKNQNLGEQAKYLCRFDMESGTFTDLYVPDEETMSDLFATDEYLYFNLVSTEENAAFRYRIGRCHLKTKKVDILTEQSEQRQTAYQSKDGRVFWQDGLGSYFSTDVNFADRREGDRSYSDSGSMGDYYFDLERTGFDDRTFSYLFRLTRINSITGEKTVSLEEVGCFPILYGNKIIYSKLDEPKLLGDMYDEESGEYKPYYDKWGGKYYICDTDGSNERLLCDFGDTGYAIPVITGLVGTKNGIGDWIAVRAPHYTAPDENGRIEQDRMDYLLINIITGEVKVAEVETRS